MKYILIFLIGLLLSGCDNKIPYNIYLTNFYKNKNNNLVIELSNITTSLQKFALVDGVWIATNASNTLNREKIIYDTTNHKVSVKDSNNKTIFTDTSLPTIKDIELATGKNLTNRKIYYNAYRDGKNFTWDRKTYLISACKDLSSSCLQFFAIKQNNINTYNIGFLKSNPQMDGIILEQKSFRDHFPGLLALYSTSSKSSACLVDETLIYPPGENIKLITDAFVCLQKENNKIIEKKMFGDIYPINYLKSILSLTDTPMSTGFIPVEFFFDEKDNLHVFYHISYNNADKYISYAMFTPDEPTIPKNKQKIYWK